MSGKPSDEADEKQGIALRLRKRARPPKPDSDLPQPLGVFAEYDLLRIEAALREVDIRGTASIRELSSLSDRAKELLLVQAEMLISSGKHYSAKPKLLDASFNYTILKKKCADGCDGLYIAGNTPGSKNRIEVAVNEDTIPLSDLLVHEMTHAIDDIYDNRKCADRVVSVLERMDPAEQRRIIDNVSEIFARDLHVVFQKEYVEPTLNPNPDFVALCKEGMNKDSRLSEQERSAITLSKEFVSFAYETLFHELRDSRAKGKDSLQKRYEALANSGAKELMAAAMYGVNQHMIEHIEESAVLTPERLALQTQLKTLQREFEESYRSGRERSSDTMASAWSIETVKSRREASSKSTAEIEQAAAAPATAESYTSANLGGASAAASASTPPAVAGNSSDSPRLVRQVDDVAIRMRAVLTKIEAESGGKVKYGDLKRTISPIRTRPGRN